MLDVKGYEGLYAITKDGRVWSYPKYKGSNHKGQFLKPYLVKGYPTVDIGIRRSKRVTKKVHRLVAEAYLPCVNGKVYINHIDGVKTNNNLDNLEWCNHTENLKHAYDTGLRTSNKGKKYV